MFSTFVVGMAHEPHITTIPQFVQSLPKWYTIPQQRPTACFLYEAWSFKTWFEPYLHAVRGTSQPHAFRFEFSAEGVTEMFTKDYLSSDSAWLGPDEFLRFVPHDEPTQLSPAQLDSSILKDTILALERINHFRHLLLILWHDSIHLIHVIMSLIPSSGLITTAILLMI